LHAISSMIAQRRRCG